MVEGSIFLVEPAVGQPNSAIKELQDVTANKRQTLTERCDPGHWRKLHNMKNLNIDDPEGEMKNSKHLITK